MNSSIIEKSDISKLEEILLVNGEIQNLPYDVLNQFPQEKISLFCHKYGIYQIPTVELINFIKKEIGDKKAIEIGSGNGCIGRALGIKMTDNKMQERPEIKQIYLATGQPVITYGKDVELIDGIEAIKKYRPEVVVACWITQKFKEGMKDGNIFGVEEELIFENGVEKYIHVGNEKTHSNKVILDKFPVKKFKHKTIISRSMSREDNIIYVFTKK